MRPSCANLAAEEVPPPKVLSIAMHKQAWHGVPRNRKCNIQRNYGTSLCMHVIARIPARATRDLRRRQRLQSHRLQVIGAASDMREGGAARKEDKNYP